MVYIEPVHLGWKPLIETWYEEKEEELPEEIRDFIKTSLLQVFEVALKHIRKNCKEVIASVDANLVQSCLRLIDSFLNNLDFKKKDRIPNPKRAMGTYLCFAIIWSVGANLHDDSRQAFNVMIKMQLKKLIDHLPESDVYELGINGELHDFQPWKDQVPEFKYDPEASFFDILVPTTDTTKYKFLLLQLLSNGSNVLITGETGVGKSVVTKDFLNFAPETIVNACVNFSGKTTTRNLLDGFEGNLEQKRKTLLGPSAGKHMVFFIDDVNMPEYDRFGSQPPCELLRQTIDQ